MSNIYDMIYDIAEHIVLELRKYDFEWYDFKQINFSSPILKIWICIHDDRIILEWNSILTFNHIHDEFLLADPNCIENTINKATQLVEKYHGLKYKTISVQG